MSDRKALEVIGLSKSFAGNLALSSLNLTIEPGEIHVLVGQNGSGKSTLIKILSGYHHPDPGGTVQIGGDSLAFGSPEDSFRLGCRFVHQDLGLIGSMSILDNFSIGSGFPTRFGKIRGRVAARDAVNSLSALGLMVDPREKVSTLASAHRTELAVARALRTNLTCPSRVLVMDEPTATLPIDEVDQLLETVRLVAAQGVAVLFVTHHLDEVFRIGHRVSVLRDGKLIGTSGVDDIDRATLVSQLVGTDFAVASKSIDVKVNYLNEPSLLVDDLLTDTVKSVSFQVHQGEIIGIAGLTGSGRETVLGAVFGSVAREAGNVIVAGQSIPPLRPDLSIKARLGYLPGDRKIHGGVMLWSACENLTLPGLRPFWSRLKLSKKMEIKEVDHWFSALNVRPPGAFRATLASFSGGNQQKILFAKWRRLGLSVFLLDEPTQGVDVGAKAELHRNLLDMANMGAAIVISSTDTEELVALCSRILVFRGGRIACELSDDQLNEESITRRMLGGDLMSHDAGDRL